MTGCCKGVWGHGDAGGTGGLTSVAGCCKGVHTGHGDAGGTGGLTSVTGWCKGVHTGHGDAGGSGGLTSVTGWCKGVHTGHGDACGTGGLISVTGWCKGVHMGHGDAGGTGGLTSVTGWCKGVHTGHGDAGGTGGLTSVTGWCKGVHTKLLEIYYVTQFVTDHLSNCNQNQTQKGMLLLKRFSSVCIALPSFRVVNCKLRAVLNGRVREGRECPYRAVQSCPRGGACTVVDYKIIPRTHDHPPPPLFFSEGRPWPGSISMLFNQKT